MKRIIAVLFLVNSYVFAQTGIQFSTPIVVTSGSTYSYINPKVTLDANNNPVVLWGKSTTDEVFVATYNGTGFNAPVKINPPGTTPYIAFWYNADLKSAGDTIVSTFSSDNGFHTYFVKSIDGGNTWGDTVRVDNLPAGSVAYFPSLDINENGNIAVSFMRHEAGWLNPRYVMSTSLDGGNTFGVDTNASAVAPGDEVCDCCPAEVLYEGNREVLLFRDNNANLREYYAAVSNDNGNSFTGINMDNLGWNISACPSSAPSAITWGDSLVNVFMSGGTGPLRVFLSTADINTMQLGYVRMVDSIVPGGTQQNFPQIAGKDSVMGMVWYNNLSGEQDIYFRYSKTGPTGLIGSGINISNPTTGVQHSPDIAYANGVFHIVYQNSSTQEVFYLTATLDEYIGIDEEHEQATFNIQISENILSLLLQPSATLESNAHIYDLQGRLVDSKRIVDQTTIFDLTGYQSGMYWIQVDGFNGVRKFIR